MRLLQQRLLRRLLVRLLPLQRSQLVSVHACVHARVWLFVRCFPQLLLCAVHCVTHDQLMSAMPRGGGGGGGGMCLSLLQRRLVILLILMQMCR